MAWQVIPRRRWISIRSIKFNAYDYEYHYEGIHRFSGIVIKSDVAGDVESKDS